jgi:hypothetical protein
MNVTKQTLLLLTSFCLAGISGAQAAEEKKHDDHEKAIEGPNHGRVITAVEPHLEFFVTADRKVKITALGEDGKAVALTGQLVTVTSGDRSNPTRMTFAPVENALVSDVAFPEGNDLPVVVQIKTSADAKSVTEKFNLNLDQCPTCDHKEYACICEHGGEEKEGAAKPKSK